MKRFMAVLVCMFLFFSAMSMVSFAESIYTYTVTDEEVTITAVKKYVSGYIEIPEEIEGLSVVKIGDGAFSGCENISGIEISKTVREIGSLAFEGCTNLQTIVIPESVKKIGRDAFDNVLFKEVYIESFESWLETEFESACSNPMYVGEVYYIDGKRVPSEDDEYFIIPEGVTELKPYSLCGFLANNVTLVLPESLEKIGEGAINVMWGEYVIYNGSPESFEKIEIGEDNDDLLNAEFIFRKGQCGENVYFSLSEEGVLTISGSGDMYNSDRDEWEKSDVKKAVIEEGVTSIGDSAFYGCENLEVVELPEGIEKIGAYAFGECTALTKIEIPGSVTYIGDWAFSVCNALTEIKIPDGITGIEAGTFKECRALEYIEIPGSVTYVGGRAFYRCKKLETVWYYGDTSDFEKIDIDEDNEPLLDARKIYAAGVAGDNARWKLTPEEELIISGSGEMYDWSWDELPFGDTTDIKKITVEEGITYIGVNSFYGSKSLKYVSIPATVKGIGGSAFNLIPEIETVSFGGSRADWEKIEIGKRNDALLNAEIIFAEISIPGDVTGDGSVTRADLLRLAKHFSGFTVELDEAAADVTGDGEVTRADLLRLAKHFSGFDVVLGA